MGLHSPWEFFSAGLACGSVEPPIYRTYGSYHIFLLWFLGTPELGDYVTGQRVKLL
jgi:hypothetical protein